MPRRSIVLTKLLPKLLFRQFPNRLCITLARPFRFVHLALMPLVFVVSMFADVLHRISGGKTFTGSLFGDLARLDAQGFAPDIRFECIFHWKSFS